MSAPTTPESLRAAIRDVVRECVTAMMSETPIVTPTAPIRVSIVDDAGLQEFVSRVLDIADDPIRRRSLLSGETRFELDVLGAQASTPPPREALPEHVESMTVESGAVTEKMVNGLEGSGTTRLIVGPRAILTPLARERARKLGISVERKRR